MKRKNNKFIFIAVIITLIISCAIIFKDKLVDLNLPNINTTSKGNEYTILYQGQNESNIVGKINYQDKEYKYAGSFQETFANISVNDSKSNSDAVKRVSSGLIAVDYNGNPITLRIDFVDEYDNKDKNIRTYNIKVEYEKISKEFTKEVKYKNYILNPLYNLNLKDIIIEAGVWK